MSEQTYSRWFTEWPSTHERAGQTVEVIPVEAITDLLTDRTLDAMLSVMAARAGGDMRLVERCDLRAAILEVLGWEGIHAER